MLDARYRRDYPGNDDLDVSVYATPLQQQLVSGSLRLNLLVAWGAVSCLLLIAAANIANLLLSRAAAPTKRNQRPPGDRRQPLARRAAAPH